MGSESLNLRIWGSDEQLGPLSHRVLGTSLGDTCPNHHSDSYYGKPCVLYTGA